MTVLDQDRAVTTITNRLGRRRAARPMTGPKATSLQILSGRTEGVPRRWHAFALLAVAFFMTIVDLTIVNVALPTIGRKLHFPEADLQWVVTAYALTFGGFLLLGGRAADLLGRRRLLMAGLAIFTAASLACALATTDTFLVIMRGAEGLGAALVLPAALSIVMNMFTEGAERNKALGIWGGIGAGGATVGVLAGGLLTRYVGWEYIFFLNVPIGAAVLALAPRVVPESRRRYRKALRPSRCPHRDRWLGALVYAISKRPRSVGARPGLWPPGRRRRAPRWLHGGGGRFVLAVAAHAPVPPRRGWRQRRRVLARRQLLHVHLRRDPVHAAGARVLGSKDRVGLADGVAHLGGLAGLSQTLVTKTSAKAVMALGMGLIGAASSGRAKSRSTAISGPPGRAVLRDRRRHRVRFHPGVDRSPRGRGRTRCRCRLGPAQHLPAARRGDRRRRCFDRCRIPHPRPGPPRDYGTAAALTGGFGRALWVCGLVGLAAVSFTFVLVRRQELARAVAASLGREAPVLVPAD